MQVATNLQFPGKNITSYKQKAGIDLDQQIARWKSVFDVLMKHDRVVNRECEPQDLALSELSPQTQNLYCDAVNDFYAFVYKYLTNENDKDQLEDFYKEDIELLTSLELTHELFIFSTFRLGILMDKESILSNSIVEVELKQMIDNGDWSDIRFYKETFGPRVFQLPNYPLSLVAPLTLAEGEISIKAFLDAFLLHDYPFGLAAIPTDSTYVHGGTMAAPGLFYSHDLLHWPVFGKLVNRYPGRWERLQKALKLLYSQKKYSDDVLNYFIFMILHEGALDDKFGLNDKENTLGEDIQFLISQVYSEMINRFDYHKSFLKNFLLAKLQSLTNKAFKLYAVDEIDEQKLEVEKYKRTSATTYAVQASLVSKGKKAMALKCNIELKDKGEKFFVDSEITHIEVSSLSSNNDYTPKEVEIKLKGGITVKNPRYFFYIDVKDHLKVYRRLTSYSESKDAYPKFLPWVKQETKRLLEDPGITPLFKLKEM